MYRPVPSPDGNTNYKQSLQSQANYPVNAWQGDGVTGDYRIAAMMQGNGGFSASISSNGSSQGGAAWTNIVRSTGNANAGMHIFGERYVRQGNFDTFPTSPNQISYIALYVMCFTGVDTTNPILAVSSYVNTGTSGTVSTVPTPTTDMGEHLMVTFIGGVHNTSGIGCTHTVTGMTGYGTAFPTSDVGVAVNVGCSISGWTQRITETGSNGTRSRTISPAPDSGSVAVSIALKGLPQVSGVFIS